MNLFAQQTHQHALKSKSRLIILGGSGAKDRAEIKVGCAHCLLLSSLNNAKDMFNIL